MSRGRSGRGQGVVVLWGLCCCGEWMGTHFEHTLMTHPCFSVWLLGSQTLPCSFSDGHVEAHVGTADGFTLGLNRFNKKGNFRSASVSTTGCSHSRKYYVNVFFFFFFKALQTNWKTRTLHHFQDFSPHAQLSTVTLSGWMSVCLSLCWKAAPRFHSDSQSSDQMDTKYSWWQTIVAKWRLVGRMDGLDGFECVY